MNGSSLRLTLVGVLASLAAYFEKIGMALAVLIGVMILDYLTGMMKAYLSGSLSSKKGLRGILKKLGYLIVIVTGAVCDYILIHLISRIGVTFSLPFLVSLVITVWLIVNELISILENLSTLGVPFPRFLMHLVKRLAVYVEKSAEIEKEENDESN